MIRLELQKLINERGITQLKLSETSGVRQARISQICTGKAIRLELEHVDAICNALDVEPSTWIVWEKNRGQLTTSKVSGQSRDE